MNCNQQVSVGRGRQEGCGDGQRVPWRIFTGVRVIHVIQLDLQYVTSRISTPLSQSMGEMS
jgi:hypothetical protein